MNLNEIKSTLKSRVAKGLNFGIEALEEVLDPSSDIYNDYILLQSKYNDLMYISTMNTLPYEQIAVGQDQLRANLLGLISKLEENSLKKQQVDSGLKVQALPTRRTNFFKLLDIHFMNLEGIQYIEIYGDKETKKIGRNALFEWYQLHRRKFRNQEEVKQSGGKKILKEYFHDYFSHESGTMEVYFKNVKHLMAYALESEVEQGFFLDTLRSLFSRFELAMIFYFAFSEVEPGFRELVLKANLMEDSVKEILIVPEHFSEL